MLAHIYYTLDTVQADAAYAAELIAAKDGPEYSQAFIDGFKRRLVWFVDQIDPELDGSEGITAALGIHRQLLSLWRDVLGLLAELIEAGNEVAAPDESLGAAG